MEVLAVCCGSAIVAGLLYLISGFRIVNEYERGVVFRLGRITKGARGPGWFFILPGLERMLVVDLRVITLDVPSQECISRDNVTLRVNAVVYYRVLAPIKAVITIKNFNIATLQIAQTTLRSIIGQHELDQLLSQRERINEELQKVIDEQTEPWGIKVSVVEIKDVELPQSMQRVMARQAEADRERRAKIIHAEGEFQAAIQLRQAAQEMSNEPISLQLRYLQTLTEIAVEKNSTILFPIPIDILEAFIGRGVSKDQPAPPPPPPQE